MCIRDRAIAGYKAQHGLPVLDAAREEAVVEKNLAALGAREKAMAPYYEAVSYTHLDVYKRQAEKQAAAACKAGRNAVQYRPGRAAGSFASAPSFGGKHGFPPVRCV